MHYKWESKEGEGRDGQGRELKFGTRLVTCARYDDVKTGRRGVPSKAKKESSSRRSSSQTRRKAACQKWSGTESLRGLRREIKEKTMLREEPKTVSMTEDVPVFGRKERSR